MGSTHPPHCTCRLEQLEGAAWTPVHRHGQSHGHDGRLRSNMQRDDFHPACLRHFASEFADKHKGKLDDVLSNVKAMAKMMKQVRRTKEILSANTQAPFSVEEFYDGIDFQVTWDPYCTWFPCDLVSGW